MRPIAEQQNKIETMTLTTLSKVPDIIFFTLSALITFFSPMTEQYIFLLVIIVANTISGICLAGNRNESFSWAKLCMIFPKIGWYSLITIVGWIVDTIFVYKAFNHRYMFSIFILLLALTEFKSIADNVSSALGFDIWARVIKAFRKDITHNDLIDEENK